MNVMKSNRRKCPELNRHQSGPYVIEISRHVQTHIWG